MNRETTENDRKAILAYLERRQLYPFQVSEVPARDLGAVVVIPCFNEPDICATLDSLQACRFPGCAVEILVVINAPESTAEAVWKANQASLEAISAWNTRPHPAWLTCHVIEQQGLPERNAGVGLARKVGMDEAVGRLVSTSRADGVVISLDADCRVADSYLHELVVHFEAHRECPGVSIYFEHPVNLQSHDPIHRAIAEYELHLRYYVTGMRHAGFPYAFHTVGSSMACRAVAYARQGGMNRRQGGEDFYFIQKLAATGGYQALTSTTVYPGVRKSDRVPFGTGPAVQRALQEGFGQETYAMEIFSDLADFCMTVPELQTDSLAVVRKRYSPALAQYLDDQDFEQIVQEVRSNVAGQASFQKRLFHWFNGFRFLKFAQFASRNWYPKVPVAEAAWSLCSSMVATGSDQRPAPEKGFLPLLKWYRDNDQRGDC